MEAPSQSAAQEAKQLNITLEQEDGEWIAVLPPHPDLKNDEALGFPAPSEQEALDEARAYRAIEQSSVYKFEYDEKRDLYSVTFGNSTFSGKLLAKAYQEAQKAYAEFINKPEPPAAEPPTEAAPKQRRPRRAVTGNGSQPETAIPPLQPAVPGQPNPNKAIPPNPNITSGIGTGQGQLPPAQNVQAQNPWETLNDRLDRFEHVLFAAFEATAKALEEMKKK
jgi:hypothetical protein